MEIMPWQSASSTKRALLVHECVSVPLLGEKLLITGGGQRAAVALGSLQQDHFLLEETVTPMLERRAAHCLVNVEEKVYAIGGKQNSKPINSVEVYDVEQRSWKAVMPMKSYR